MGFKEVLNVVLPDYKRMAKGLDVVRSSFPTEFKTIMKETLWYVLKERNARYNTMTDIRTGLKVRFIPWRKSLIHWRSI